MKAKDGSSVPVVTTKFLFGVCVCTSDIDVGTSDFSIVLGILHACGHAQVRSHLSPGLDCLKVTEKNVMPK